MRTFTRGWISYLLLFVLVIAFAIWGINDMFTGMGAQNVAEVGGRKITPPQLTRELDLTLRGRRAEGANVSQQDAIDAGLHMRLLDGMIGRLAMEVYAEKIGVSASDAQVAERIRAIPAAVNPVTGQFDQAAYDRFLRELGYSRPEFENDIRGEMTTRMLMQSLASGVRAPTSYGELVLAYESETRTVSIAEAPASAVGAIPQPNEAQVQAFYEDSQEQLRLPEFRALTLVYARQEDFVARVTVPEQRLQEEFEARRAAMTRPERRTYVRITAQNEAQANDAAARLTRGEDASAVAQALSLQASTGENQARTDVPDERVAEAVFSMTANAPARVVRGQLAPFVVVRVTNITPPVEPNFAELREELRTAIATDQAIDLLSAAVSNFEEARAAGTGIADAARGAGLAVVTIPEVEQGGRNRSGQPIESLADDPDILQTAFATPEGETSDFIAARDADVMVSVDRVIPPSVRPLEEVRAELVQFWINRERARRLRERGEQVVAAVNGGQTLAQAARANGMRMVATSRPIARTAAEEELSQGLGGQVFGAREGGVVSAIRDDGGAVQVAVVERITRADPAQVPQAVQEGRERVQQGLLGSFGQAIQGEISSSVNARRNDALIERLYRPSNAESEENQ
ncbi:MAG: SurA N-terminal domain-containing protein [Hyphomonadaceae bacterium]